MRFLNLFIKKWQQKCSTSFMFAQQMQNVSFWGDCWPFHYNYHLIIYPHPLSLHLKKMCTLSLLSNSNPYFVLQFCGLVPYLTNLSKYRCSYRLYCFCYNEDKIWPSLMKPKHEIEFIHYREMTTNMLNLVYIYLQGCKTQKQ